MTDPAECRRHADECSRAAQTAATAEMKGTLVTMARLWTALAVQSQRLQALLDAEAVRRG